MENEVNTIFISIQTCFKIQFKLTHKSFTTNILRNLASNHTPFIS